MKRGRYVDTRFDDKVALDFAPHLYTSLTTWAGCGANALAMLTGINPLRIKPRFHWSDQYMVGFLRRHKFSVLEITRRNVTNSDNIERPIGKHHVVLAKLKFVIGEASWVVIFQDKVYHNFEIVPLTGYELINHPILSAYVVFHKSWR